MAKALNEVPYLSEKIDIKNQEKIDRLDYVQQRKLFPLERNALGKDYYNIEHQDELDQLENDLYFDLKEAQDKFAESVNEIKDYHFQIDRSKELIKIYEQGKQELRAPARLNEEQYIIIDEEKFHQMEQKHISEIEGLRTQFQTQLSKTKTAVNQLIAEKRESEKLFKNYQEQVDSYTHGYNVLNQALYQIQGHEFELEREISDSDLSKELKQIDSLFTNLITTSENHIEKIEELLEKSDKIEDAEQENKQEIKNIFKNYDQLVDQCNQKYTIDNYEQWQREHNTLNVQGSIDQILEANKKEYETKQAEADLEMAQLESKLATAKEVKLKKSIQKNEQKINKLNDQISSLKKEIEQETANTLNNLETGYQANLKEDPDSKNTKNLKQVLEMMQTEDNETQLLIQNLTMQFGGLKAVNDLSFFVKKNEIYGLIGPNGAGKTTVFNCLTQFYKPTEGNLLFKDDTGQLINLTDYKVHEVIDHGIVRTFQNIELIWECSILDNMLVGAHTAYKTGFFDHLLHLPSLKAEEFQMTTKAKEILERMNLLDYMDQPPVGLPYGILKRVELARTLMLNPKLIILDEPAAGLNESETIELAELIKEIRDEFNVTIFLVEHDMGLVMSVCDRITAISFGKHIATGTPQEIQMNKQVQEAYLGGE